MLLPFWATGCATVRVPNVGEQGYKIADDERRLMKRTDEMAEVIEDGGFLYEDPAFEKYLTRLANSLLSQDVRDDGISLQVKILSDPDLNAFAMANGRIYVNTGMLASAESEAQIATLLGHEITHIIHRHNLRQMRSATNTTAFFSVLMGPLMSAGGALGMMVSELGVVSSISGYSQQLEHEADEYGFKMVTARGYDPRETPKLFETMKNYIEEEDIKEPFFFSSHPNVVARIRKFNALLQDNPQIVQKGGTVDTPEFDRLQEALLPDAIKAMLGSGYFKTSERLLAKWREHHPEDIRACYFTGELFRERQDSDSKRTPRDKAADYQRAIDAYDRALAIDPDYPDAVEGKARALRKSGRHQEAVTFYRRYLELKPEAADKGYVDHYLREHSS